MCNVSPYPVQVRVEGRSFTLFSAADLPVIVSKNGKVRPFTVIKSSYQDNLEEAICTRGQSHCEVGLSS